MNDIEMNGAEASMADEEHRGQTMDGFQEIIASWSVAVGPIKGVPKILEEPKKELATSYSQRLARQEKVRPHTVHTSMRKG